VSNGFGGAFFDLCLDLRSRCGIVDDDPELILADEEATRASLTIGVEGHSLNRKIADMPANNDADKAEKATRNLRSRHVRMGAVLHTTKRKHGPVTRKAPKSPRK